MKPNHSSLGIIALNSLLPKNNTEYMKDLTIWHTYHEDKQIQKYRLQETDIIHLFRGNDISMEGENINHLDRLYAELTTIY